MTEMRVGLHSGIAAGEYHGMNAVDLSRLMILRDKSPAHLKYLLDNPPEPTAAMKLGAAIHDAVLCPGLFETEWIRAPEGDRRKKEVKDAWTLMATQYPDAEILKPEEYDTVLAVRNAITSHRYVTDQELSGAGMTGLWEDPDTGVLCKGRFDLIDSEEDARTIVDLKTMRDASNSKFARAIWNHGYYIQAAHNLSAARVLGLDDRIEYYTIIAVELEPPYAIALYRIDDEAVAQGQDELRSLLERYAECERSGEWPSYPSEVKDIALPPWSLKEIEARTAKPIVGDYPRPSK